jgi:hypothetical protein
MCLYLLSQAFNHIGEDSVEEFSTSIAVIMHNIKVCFWNVRTSFQHVVKIGGLL